MTLSEAAEAFRVAMGEMRAAEAEISDAQRRYDAAVSRSRVAGERLGEARRALYDAAITGAVSGGAAK